MTRMEVFFMDKVFHSIYAPHIKQFIQLKRKLGFEYSSGIFYLNKIDLFALERGDTSAGITKDFADNWADKKSNESDCNRYNRIGFLIQLSSYIRDLGIESYVPKLPPIPHHTFIPYVYSKEQIDAIFAACDSLRLKITNSHSCLFCMPLLLRLLYSTGLRIGEAIALKNEDVNIEDNYLLVRDSKNGKERIIPIAASLSSLCKEYIWHRDRLPDVQKNSEYFFIKANGMKCGQGVNRWFKKCLDLAGILHGTTESPRIHDLRHTFAVTALATMAESGIDLYVSLPILSNYLGHGSLGATNHYVRLTASMFPDLIKDVDMICLDVFPKYRNYEAN
ncbi:integrase/recombinase XerD [Pedobacter sp. UYP30]